MTPQLDLFAPKPERVEWGDGEERGLTGRIGTAQINIRVRKTLSARARYVLHMFRPTDSDLSTRALPASLSFAYYVLRPFRLLGRISDPKI